MNTVSRRSFLTKTATTATGLAIAGSAWAQPMGSNDDVRMAIVGMGNKGRQHLRNLIELKGARPVAICDADQVRLDEAVAKYSTPGQSLKTYRDYRNLLENKDIDAVVIATPNHWHTLMAIWACQAGKDVYLEKPVCHDIWEGQRLLEALQKYGQIIQAGTQNRSNTGFIEGMEYLRSGALGNIKWIHGVFFKLRPSLGRRRGPQRIPATVDYDLYQGPVDIKPLSRNNLHYDWHWFWDTGNGDMGNNGPHTIDNIRNLLGDDRQPNRVMSLGGRYTCDDDGQTPNVHLACLDYGDFPVFAEIRGIAYRPDASFVEAPRGSRENAIVQCEDGYMFLGKDAVVFSNDRKRIKSFTGNPVIAHMENFISAVRKQDAGLLNCPIKLGVQAGELLHTAILSYRSGFPASVDKIHDAIGHNEASNLAMENLLENLGRHGIDLDKEPLTLGSWMSLEDGGRTLKVENPDSDLVAQALFQRRHYREPYAVPEKV